jgi:hypothetical protein
MKDPVKVCGPYTWRGLAVVAVLWLILHLLCR